MNKVCLHYEATCFKHVVYCTSTFNPLIINLFTITIQPYISNLVQLNKPKYVHVMGRTTVTSFSSSTAGCHLLWNVPKSCYLSDCGCIDSAFSPVNLGRVRLRIFRNKNVFWNIFRNSHSLISHSGYSHSLFSFRNTWIPFWLFCSQEHNSRNIFRNTFSFRNIPKRTRP